VSKQKTYDVAVIGAGVFGAWTAWHLAKRGQHVALIEAYGPAHSRASSGGETRIIRMGYGADELYTRWSQKSLKQWKEFFAAIRQPLFLETGVLWMGGDEDQRLRQTSETLKRCGMPFEELGRAALEKRYPQIAFDGIECGIFEPKSGVLLARRAVAAVVEDAVRLGAEYLCAHAMNPREAGRVEPGRTDRGGRVCVCLWAVAWQGFPGRSWHANFSLAAGSVFLRHSGWRYEVHGTGAADVAVSGRPGLRNARHRGTRTEDCV